MTRYLLRVQCMNHRLKLAMKDNLNQIVISKEIKEMLFKISGKVWRVFLLRQLTNSLSDLSKRTIPTTRVRFVKADDSNNMCPICQSERFQQHVFDLCERFQQHVSDFLSGRFQHVSDLSKWTIPSTCVRFVKVDDSIHMCPICQSGRFQQYVSDAITKLMLFLLFAENAKESNHFLTNEMKQRLAVS